MLNYWGNWKEHLPLVKFAFNSSYQSIIGMAPFEALYGRPYHSPSCWLDTRDPVLVDPNLIDQIVKQVEVIKKRMK